MNFYLIYSFNELKSLNDLNIGIIFKLFIKIKELIFENYLKHSSSKIRRAVGILN